MAYMIRFFTDKGKYEDKIQRKKYQWQKNFLSMENLLCLLNVLSMKCPIYEMFHYEMSYYEMSYYEMS